MIRTPEQIEFSRLQNRLTKRFHKACADYSLIEDGDHILIALSGGKDSLALVELLGKRAQIFVPRFKVTAIHVRVKERAYLSDLSYLQSFCDAFRVPLLVRDTSIGESSVSASDLSSVSASGVPTNNMQWGASSGLSGEAGQNTQRNTPFTADQLNGAWVGLKSTFKKEQRLVAMLDAHRPRLIDDHTALITFVNPWQEEEFKKFSRQILTILRDNLQNDTLLLQTVVAENMAPKRAYTAEEKYRVLQEQNPYLADFKKQFDMLLE